MSSTGTQSVRSAVTFLRTSKGVTEREASSAYRNGSRHIQKQRQSAGMGNTVTKAADLTVYIEWSRQQADDLVQKYKENDLPFGLDATALKTLLDDSEQSSKILALFSRDGKNMNALDLLTTIAILAQGAKADRMKTVFKAFDFNNQDKISSAELVILMISLTTALYTSTTGNAVAAADEMEKKSVADNIEQVIDKRFKEDEDIKFEDFASFVNDTFENAETAENFLDCAEILLKRFDLPFEKEAAAEGGTCC